MYVTMLLAMMMLSASFGLVFTQHINIIHVMTFISSQFLLNRHVITGPPPRVIDFRVCIRNISVK